MNDEFVQGVIWYYGEIARRHRFALWLYWPDPTGASQNPYVGRPFIAQNGRRGADAIPLLELEAAVPSDEDGASLARWSDQFD